MTSKFKITTFAVLLAAAAGAGIFATGCSKPADKTAGASQAKTLFTCGMHPWIIQDHPGNCPICGMKLEPVHKIGRHDSGRHGQNSVLQIHDEAGRDQPGAGQGQHGHGHGAGV